MIEVMSRVVLFIHFAIYFTNILKIVKVFMGEQNCWYVFDKYKD